MIGTNTVLWIAIAVAVVAILVIIAVIVVGKNRAEAKKVSFRKEESAAPKELTREQKSGNYQAKSGFNFAPATGQPAAQPAAPAAGSAAGRGAAAATNQPVGEKETGEKPVTQQETKQQEAKQQEAESNTHEAATAVPASQATAEASAGGRPEDGVTVVDEQEPKASEQAAQAETAEARPAGAETAEARPAEARPAEARPAGAEAAEARPAEIEAAESEAEAVESEAEASGTATGENESVVDEVDEGGIGRQSDEREKAHEAAVAAGAQTDSAAAALEQTPVPEGTPAPTAQPQEDIAPASGRLGRLRGRLSRSQNAIGKGLMGILSAGDLDEDAWEEIEDTLIMADLGTKATMQVTESLRDKIAERGVESEEQARAMLRETLIEVCHPEMDRSIRAMPNDGKPAVVMVVGVNGTGKTTTTGKLARVLVSMGHKVLLGAADTFRAAAADQLETWGRRVGAETVRGREGADPASVAFDAVAAGVANQVDVVLIDTAGRLHTSTDLMDQLGKVKRVVEKKTAVDEVLLVIDATVGQNGLMQARVFREVVDITGVVLTKLDGTAKGGIVFQVQEELGVPVKLVGLGEGADHLAPFEVESFVDALLGTA